jgi:hypothetical protein
MGVQPWPQARGVVGTQPAGPVSGFRDFGVPGVPAYPVSGFPVFNEASAWPLVRWAETSRVLYFHIAGPAIPGPRNSPFGRSGLPGFPVS